jgi:deazaflavin-dependent oxidoreductase (nitroreductase family)
MTTRVDGGPGNRVDAVRAFNKRVLNPLMLSVAGRRHWYASRLEHHGRRSGRAYATPVVATPVPGGFVIPLPYGTRVDWLRNLDAAGGGALVSGGARFLLRAPEVLPTAELYGDLPHKEQVRARLWRIDHYVRVTAVPAG